MNQTDVLTSGGGIGGAVLAALVVRGGKRVTIVERANVPLPFLHPGLLWPAAMRTMASIRPLDGQRTPCAFYFPETPARARTRLTPHADRGKGI